MLLTLGQAYLPGRRTSRSVRLDDLDGAFCGRPCSCAYRPIQQFVKLISVFMSPL